MKVIDAAAAAALVQSGQSVVVSGSFGGHAVPEAVLAALGARYEAERAPAGLTLITSSASATASRGARRTSRRTAWCAG